MRVRHSRLGRYPEGSVHYIVSLDASVTAVSGLVVILLSIRYSKHSTVIIVISFTDHFICAGNGGLFLCSGVRGRAHTYYTKLPS